MFQLVKWANELGGKHERRRIKLLIAQYRQEKPEPPAVSDKSPRSGHDQRLWVWHEVNNALRDLTEPMYTQDNKSLLDKDGDV